MSSLESLRGYLLEEVLAYLIRNTGYRLLVDPVQDDRELDKRGNGLVVKGRGGVHQVDVLGQMLWIPAFTFPIRLFVEAKYRKVKTGLPDVRNAVGVLDDLNQNYSPITEGSNRLIKRYSYRYAIFSASAFSRTAEDYALAHQISLVDLSGPDFSDLRSLVDELAQFIIDQLPRDKKGPRFIRSLRTFIRTTSLKTWPAGVPSPNELAGLADSVDEIPAQLQASLATMMNARVKVIGELMVGMADGPFLLVFKPTNVEHFLSYAGKYPAHNVDISWSRRNGQERQWTIQPADHPGSYSLSFGLPQALADWVFGDPSKSIRRALNIKERYLSDITIYRHVNGHDQLFRLSYDAEHARDSLRATGRRR